MQQQDELLGAAHGESRHDDVSTTARGAVDDVGQFVDDMIDALVQAAAVCAFEDQVVHGLERFGIADDGQAGAAQVARETEAQRGAARLFA